LIHLVDVCIICHLGSFEDGALDVLWKIWLENDVVVEMLFQILCALIASVTVIDRKYLYLGPLIVRHFRLFLLRLNNIQNNGNSIFICFSDQTNMGIRSKRFDDSKLLVGCF
jgi:hypothetical protein